MNEIVTGMKSPHLSVIVCTYKRPALLREALKSLLDQELPPERFEVIAVDNNSGDETEAVIREFCARSPGFRYVHEEQQGLSHARNRGCEEARGDYLVYVDDDARAHPGYLATALQAILAHGPDILGGPIYPYYTSQKPSWFKDEYEIRRHADETGWSTECSISGSSFIIRREILRELGMFHPGLGMVGSKVRLGEERAVLNLYRARPAHSQKVYYHLGCVIHHHVPASKMRLAYFLKRYFVAGFAKARIERLARDRWGLLGRGKYIAKCWWGRWGWPRSNRREFGPGQSFQQRIIEQGAGLMYEAGRLAGCFPMFRKGFSED